ncbi:MAG: hypothetical protein QM786_09160 [Breznakibacter sp.]
MTKKKIPLAGTATVKPGHGPSATGRTAIISGKQHVWHTLFDSMP